MKNPCLLCCRQQVDKSGFAIRVNRLIQAGEAIQICAPALTSPTMSGFAALLFGGILLLVLGPPLFTDDADAERLAPELNNILGWVEQLGEVDVTGVQPMTAVIPNQQRLRDDVVTDGNVRDKVLANAPQAEHGFFAVPKVIE